ncbi:RNA polymerase sigma-70 factor, ECF subfamily [Rhizobium sp. NFR07]|uniref:sigma-70 family RNA polymerase sigma factor n=1 Tax=Rhizobium sp. NFR07 TaxID=1566262 RepID=UPI0008E4E64F|nr:RNA polymerase sigma-70 factor, ECF subfamily [Rhizobium sp. NFR07]
MHERQTKQQDRHDMSLDADNIYMGHRAALISYSARILGSRDAAEDIVQEAYLRFVPDMPPTETARQGLAYLYRIVRNLSLDMVKRRKIEQRAQSDDPPFWIVPRASDTPEQTTMFCDEVRIAQQVLASLPEDIRIAVEMHRHGGQTLDAVAKHLGVSVATAHRHVRTAMVKIAVALDRKNA